jgi:hypothetical protein
MDSEKRSTCLFDFSSQMEGLLLSGEASDLASDWHLEVLFEFLDHAHDQVCFF